MYRLNTVPNKELDKLILKHTWRTKGPRLAETLFKEEEKEKEKEQCGD